MPNEKHSPGGTSSEAEAFDSTLSMTHASQKLGVVSPLEHEISPGTRIYHYEIIREVARGGMGTIYLARDTKLGRRVAVKILHERARGESERILAEARATARCNHENIVVIHEVDEYRGSPFMVLEYLSGQPLSSVLSGTPLPHGRVVELVVPVMRALACAHEQGIVHRDLKPENIIVTDSGTIKVLDFGIAKFLGRSDLQKELPGGSGGRRGGDEALFVVSDRGSLTGTLPYMSPEQWGSGEVDHRSDLWAVGIILYVMLTGRHPLSPLSLDRLRQTAVLDRPMPSIRDAGGDIAGDIPDELAAIVDACLIKDKEQRMSSASELLAALEQLLPYGRKLTADTSPYTGLASFQESDAERFFGRSRDIAALVARLRDRALIGVIGPSGAGKSSFVSAGVIPALKSSGEAWASLTMRPGRRPLAQLAGVLTPFLPDPGKPRRAAAMLLERLREEPGYAGALLRSWAREHEHKIVLFVDQFEELYTLASDARERTAFAACLLGMADDASSLLRVIVAARSDFLDRAAVDRSFMDELTLGLCFLPPPDRTGLREALVQPAEMAGYKFESDKMVETLLDALEVTPAALPLLQFTAAILWDSRDRAQRLLTEDSYRRIGGIAGALVDHADKLLAGLPTHLQRLSRTLFRRLVTPERTRDIVALDELCDVADNPSEIEQLVDYFVDARLLVVHQGSESEVPQVEIVHESLITSWPTLSRWLDENQEAAAFLAELRAAARQWRAHGRSQGLLWRGDAEESARRWHQHCADDLSELESEYLQAVFALADRSTRRKRRLIAGTIALLSALVAAAVIALVLIRDAEQTARDETARARHAEHLAEKRAEKVLSAERRIREQYNELTKEREATEQAEKRAAEAENLRNLTRSELITALRQARDAKRASEQAKKVAQNESQRAKRAAQEAGEASARAHNAAREAQEATAAERQAKEKLQLLLREKEAKIRRLEKKIITDDLK